MPELLYQSFSVTGGSNAEVQDTGITSTEAEKKLVRNLIVTTSGQAGNLVRVYLEREKKLEIYDYNLDTYEASGTDMYKSTRKIIMIPLNVEVPVGQTLKVAISCGATNKNIQGAYQYEIV